MTIESDLNQYSTPEKNSPLPKVAIFGASGHIGNALAVGGLESHKITAVSRKETFFSDSEQVFSGIDVTNLNAVMQIVEKLKLGGISSIINATGVTSVDLSESDRGDETSEMYQVNVLGTKNLATACLAYNIKFIHLSTRYVFNGNKETPYSESDEPDLDINSAPTWYGITKALAEQAIEGVFQDRPSNFAIIRLPQVQTPTSGLFNDVFTSLKNNKQIKLMSDQLVAPITVQTVVKAIYAIEKKLQAGDISGIINVNALDASTPYNIAQSIAEVFGFSKDLLIPVTRTELNMSNEKKKRPANTVLNTQLFQVRVAGDILGPIQREIEIFAHSS